MSADNDGGYTALRDAIIAGRLQPNERLVEADITQKLGVGRAAVRTALARLEQEGLVVRERNRGARVRLIEADEAVEILEARAVLEGLAARHAAINATAKDVVVLRGILKRMRAKLDQGDLLGASDVNAELHEKLLRLSRHGTADRLISTLKSQLVRFQYRTILLPGRSRRSYAEHEAIVDAVAAHDPQGAETAMRTHLSHVAEALRERVAGEGRRMTDDLQPSDRARELCQGAYDVHIHISPDVVPRKVDDVTLAKRFLELGMAGFVLKSHYTSTAERAAVVRAAVPGADVRGAIALNRAVGGLNPLAVEVAAREGARTVWLPTVDSINEAGHLAELPPGAKLPVWVKLQQDLRDRGIVIDPVPITDESGALVPELHAVLETIAQHQLVLATGHLSRDEIFLVVDAAKAAGIDDVVVTHPEFPSQKLGPDDQNELVRRGALLERCFTTPHTGKVDWQVWIDNIRATGAENSVLSTDLGQTFNPPVEDGLALMVDRLIDAGFDDEEIKLMAVTNTRRLAGADR